jgi:hypothetical protein
MADRVFVTSDPHGHLEPLVAELTSAGLLDDRADWAGGSAQLYMLGDLFDRGPAGIGIVDLMMKLESQAPDAGGSAVTLLGNHEVLAVGTKLFGSTDLDIDGRARNFAHSWLRNGGIEPDQRRMTDEHVEWIRSLPAMVTVGDYVLMHSDTLEYVEWGESVDEINAGLEAALASDDAMQWWDVFWRLTTRYVYSGEDGAYQAGAMLDRLGGRLLVHGHSIVGDLLDIESEKVDGPLLYAEEQVLAVDGGMYDGGPCLLVELPVDADQVMRMPAEAEPRRNAETDSHQG